MNIIAIILVSITFAASLSCGADENINVAEHVRVKHTALPDEYNAVCSMVDLQWPKISDSDSSYSNIRSQANIYLPTGTLLSSTWMVVEVIDDMYVSTACLPMKNEYRVQIIIDHHPEDGLSLCPKRIHIEDLLEFSTLNSTTLGDQK